MLSEELILHFLPKMFKSYEIREKALLRITRNADIDTETIYDEDLVTGSNGESDQAEKTNESCKNGIIQRIK